jgi:hypothetical protein
MNLVQIDGRICYKFKFKSVFKYVSYSVFKSVMKFCLALLGARTSPSRAHRVIGWTESVRAAGG